MHHTISVLRAREVEKSCLHAFTAAQPDEDVFKYQMPWISIKDLNRWHLNSLSTKSRGLFLKNDGTCLNNYKPSNRSYICTNMEISLCLRNETD